MPLHLHQLHLQQREGRPSLEQRMPLLLTHLRVWPMVRLWWTMGPLLLKRNLTCDIFRPLSLHPMGYLNIAPGPPKNGHQTMPYIQNDQAQLTFLRCTSSRNRFQDPRAARVRSWTQHLAYRVNSNLGVSREQTSSQTANTFDARPEAISQPLRIIRYDRRWARFSKHCRV